MAKLLPDLIAFFLGLTAGSFVCLCAYRIPRAESVVFGPSHCDHCGVPLRLLDKLPLLGYLTKQGRSRCCSHRISSRYPILESVTGIVFVLIYRQFAVGPVLLVMVTFSGWLLLGMLIDLDRRIIPDKITLTGIGMALLIAGFLPHLRLREALLGVVVCGGFLYLGGRLGESIFNTPQAMGGGDIKFAAMIGAFLGWQQGLTAVILAALAGTGFGLVRIMVRRQSRELPFGPFLALGAVVNLLWGNEIIAWYFSLTAGQSAF